MASTVCSSRTFLRARIADTSWCTCSSRTAARSLMRSMRSAAMLRASVRRWPWQSLGSGRLNYLLYRPFQMETTMSEASIAPIRTWLAGPMDPDVSEAIERLRRAPDVQQIAVMPDVHMSADVCIGVVVATSCLIYPQAVGGDIGCGMLAVGLDLEAAALDNPRVAGQVLTDLGRAVPARRRNRSAIISQPSDLASGRLSHPGLESVRRTEAAIQFATLGSG